MVPLQFHAGPTSDDCNIIDRSMDYYDDEQRTQPTDTVSPDTLTSPAVRTTPTTPIRSSFGSHSPNPDPFASARPLRRASPPPIPLHLYPSPGGDRHVERGPQPDDSEGSAASTISLDFDYLATCQFVRFDPRVQQISSMDLLFELARLFGPGITRAQFVRLWRRCTRCRRLCFVERRHYHACDAVTPDLSNEGFDIVAAALSCEANSGIAMTDFCKLFRRCVFCRRIGLQIAIAHECLAV
ncbi:hypothetical protein NMY22_g15196 [Coprinellus aureogranulatus]|nr:hypothetical protein NMY22_g15196 [Coprinellus aureogranulatus]